MADVNAIIRLQVKEEVSTQLRRANNEIKVMKGSADNTKKSLSGMFGEFAAARVVMALSTASIAMIGKQAIMAASELETMEKRARITFGEALPELEQNLGSFAKEVGRSRSDLLGFSTGFAQLIDSMGVGSEEMMGMSANLSKLAVDFASFAGGSDAEAFDALRMAITGSGKALKNYGVVMDDGTLSAYALSQGIKESVSSMDEASQMQLRYAFIMDQTKNVQGDAARSSGDYANQVKALQAQWQDMLETLGQSGLIFVATEAIKLLGDMLTIVGQAGHVAAAGINAAASAMKFGANALGFENFGIKDYRGPALLNPQPNKRASGGFSSGLTLVGEQGPELVSLPGGSYVHNAGSTASMLGGGGMSVRITAPLIGSVVVAGEADENRLASKLARAIQLRSLQAA